MIPIMNIFRAFILPAIQHLSTIRQMFYKPYLDQHLTVLLDFNKQLRHKVKSVLYKSVNSLNSQNVQDLDD